MLSGFLFEFFFHNLSEGGSFAEPAYPVHALQRLQVMEAMAPDEMDQDHGQKRGREELEDTVQDQIRAKEHEIRDLIKKISEKEDEIKGVEKEIAIASGTEVRKPLEEKLQFLRQQIISLRQEISSRDQQISSLRSVQEARASAAEITDCSEVWIGDMLLPQLPEISQNKAGLEKVLFPEPHRKLPVPQQLYRDVAGRVPQWAANFLIKADGSRLPSAVGIFLLNEPEEVATEILTTLLVAGGLSLVFGLLKQYIRHFKVTLSFNTTERAWNSYSQATELRTRPDTIATASGCIF